MAIEKFQLPSLQWSNFFDHQPYCNWKFSITNRVVIEKNSITTWLATKCFWLPSMWWPKVFSHHMNGDWKHSITNRVVTNFFSINTCLWMSIVRLTVDWFPALIWWQNLVLPCNKMYTLHVNIHFLLWGVRALCCLTPTIVIYFRKEGWNLYGCLNFRSYIIFTIGVEF